MCCLFVIATLEASAAGDGIYRGQRRVIASCIGAALGMPSPRQVCGGRKDSMSNCKTHAHIIGIERVKGRFSSFSNPLNWDNFGLRDLKIHRVLESNIVL